MNPTRLPYTIEDQGDTLKITIPTSGKRMEEMAISLLLLLALGIYIISTLLNESTRRSDAALAWCVFAICIPGCTYFAGKLLWELAGTQTITIGPDSITVNDRAFLLNRTSECWQRIEHMRVIETVHHFRWYTYTRYAIAFNCNENRITLSDDLSETDNEQLLAAIHKKFPQYRNPPTPT